MFGYYRLAAAAFLALLVFAGIAAGEDPFSAMNVERPKTRVAAPAFTLTSVDGTSVSLKEFHGKVVMLHFWATWCLPCRVEMPVMETLWRRFKDQGFVILAIAADRGPVEPVRRFLTERGLTFPALHDPGGTVRNEYEIDAFPTTYFIGKDGRISGRIVGAASWESPAAAQIIESLLRGGS